MVQKDCNRYNYLTLLSACFVVTHTHTHDPSVLAAMIEDTKHVKEECVSVVFVFIITLFC